MTKVVKLKILGEKEKHFKLQCQEFTYVIFIKHLKRNRSTHRFMSYDSGSNDLGLLTSQYLFAAPQHNLISYSHHSFHISILSTKTHEHAHQEKFLPHRFTFITSQIGIKQYLTISDHSQLNFLQVLCI